MIIPIQRKLTFGDHRCMERYDIYTVIADGAKWGQLLGDPWIDWATHARHH